MRTPLNSQDSDASGEDPGYWISISDLMSGLLIIFILALTYYMLTYSEESAKYREKTDKLTQNDILRREILYTIEAELKRRDIMNVQVDASHGVLRLQEGILFDSGEDQVKEQGRAIIQVLGPVLKNVLGQEKYIGRVETVFVEGHTDSKPISIRFKSNWELSTQRAINTWRELRLIAPSLENLHSENGEPLFSCSGYADTRPIDTNTTEEGRRKNRRIDLRFAMSPPRRDEPPIVKDVLMELKQKTP